MPEQRPYGGLQPRDPSAQPAPAAPAAAGLMATGLRPTDRVRPNFLRREFGHPGNEAPQMDEAFLDKLQAFRQRVGRPVRITSGHRTVERNRQVGGVPSSEHLTGRAVDLQVPGLTAEQLLPIAQEMGFTGIGVYRGHLHVDTGKRQKVWYKETP